MYRQFTDEQGGTWEAWEVHPSSVERRSRGERRTSARLTADRRQRHEVRAIVPLELAAGWLAFHGTFDRMRLAPIPLGWTHLSDAELVRLLHLAGQVDSSS